MIRSDFLPASTASRLARWAATALAVVVVAGCASGPAKPKPGPLEAISSPLPGRVVWQQRIGNVQFPLAIAVNGSALTVASSDGTMASIEADTGRVLWRVSLGARLGAGVGGDGRHAAVVSRDGELFVLDSGRLAWRKKLGIQVNTEPLVAGARVFVLGSDRSVRAFDVLDGRQLWEVRRSGEPLTLAQRGVIAPYKNTLLVGQGPRLVGLDPDNGTVRWEVAIAAPRGTNEIERLADLVGPAVRVGETVCARAFQAAITCVNAERGALSWTRNLGGTDGLGADEELVAAADASDRVSTWKTGSGDAAWSSEKLLYRELATPLVTRDAVVFGDAQGTVHFLSKGDGATRLRLPTDGSAIVGTPVLAGRTIVVATRNGSIVGIRSE
ncbi:outer membrane protein assembly factor BamB [Piscinibacter sakaiensis]|uniref:outer membrane protein assembly factor BamB n=1 Tax=Piscinibacter sakaiensis TaxID=1547922 RepID=UPI003AB0D771